MTLAVVVLVFLGISILVLVWSAVTSVHRSEARCRQLAASTGRTARPIPQDVDQARVRETVAVCRPVETAVKVTAAASPSVLASSR